MAGKYSKNKIFYLYVYLIIFNSKGVNQAYVSKFLRGDFSDLSENGKTLIYKWYLKFTKNPMLLARQNGK